MDVIAPGANRPFRGDLVTPDQLGSLLDGCNTPKLWFLDELVVCAARVLARGGGGQLHFVGRSADSVFDLLSGALAGTSWAGRLHRLPFSFRDDTDGLSSFEISRARANFTASGLDPTSLAHGRGPVAFVDLVAEGFTFTNLYRLLRPWVEQERAQWDVIRRKLHFVGITIRRETSPKTWRWHQDSEWTRDLPASAIRNISLDSTVWYYLGNSQTKLTRSFGPSRWTSVEADGPRHDDMTRDALAEAVALVTYGRTTAARAALVGAMAADPSFSQAWLRNLAIEMRR